METLSELNKSYLPDIKDVSNGDRGLLGHLLFINYSENITYSPRGTLYWASDLAGSTHNFHPVLS